MAAPRPIVTDAGKLRQMTAEEFDDLRWHVIPLGVPFDIWTHLPGVEVPPTDNPNYRYIKLTASDSYNDGVLTSESVSGSAPLVQATAVISDASSPLNGQTVRLINTERRFIRPGSSGTVEADAFQGHRVVTPVGGASDIPSQWTFGLGAALNGVTGNAYRSGMAGGISSDPVTNGTNGTPRTADETRVKSIGADVFMRIR